VIAQLDQRKPSTSMISLAVLVHPGEHLQFVVGRKGKSRTGLPSGIIDRFRDRRERPLTVSVAATEKCNHIQLCWHGTATDYLAPTISW
jgi:hypothetical protein